MGLVHWLSSGARYSFNQSDRLSVILMILYCLIQKGGKIKELPQSGNLRVTLESSIIVLNYAFESRHFIIRKMRRLRTSASTCFQAAQYRQWTHIIRTPFNRH